MPEISSSAYSETDALNNVPPPGGFPEGMNMSGLNDSARAVMGAIKRFWGRSQGRYASTGSANAYVLTPDVALTAYVAGERYSFRANFANTGSATLNISGVGARTIKKFGNGATSAAALTGGEIQNSQPVTVEYNGTDMILVTPSGNEVENVNALTEDTSPDASADFLLSYDSSAGMHKKVKPSSLHGAFFSAHKNGSNQGSVTHSSETKVTFTTEEADAAAVYDSTNSKFVPPSGQIWVIGAAVNFTDAGDGEQMSAVLYKNGSAYKRSGREVTGSTVAHGAGISGVVVQGNGTDFYEIYAGLSNSGASRTVDGSSVVSWFMAFRIG